MSVVESIRTCFSKYITFQGRAQRSEFWWFVLFVLVGQCVFIFVDSALFVSMASYDDGFGAPNYIPFLTALFLLGTMLPSISVTVRRLHDTDRSGWWYWLAMIPLIGAIILIVWYASKGTNGPNRFGNDPLGGRGYSDMDDGDYAISSIPRSGG